MNAVTQLDILDLELTLGKIQKKLSVVEIRFRGFQVREREPIVE